MRVRLPPRPTGTHPMKSMAIGGYEVLSEIGRGGAGRVLRARGPGGRDVAIKLLLQQRPDALARFEREASVLRELGEAEGFVPLLDAGLSQTVGPYLVFPFIPGGTLRSRFRRGALRTEDVSALGLSLAFSLGRAHERGIVHRDMKPENIIFTGPGATAADWGQPLVADLGLAKHFAG